MRRHFQVFPFELEHICTDRCLKVGLKCVQYARNIFPQDIRSIIESNLKVLEKEPVLANAKSFYLRVDFPTSRPLVKLVNTNGFTFTVEKILLEFQNFLRDIYTLEAMTIQEEKYTVDCSNCVQEKFDHLESRAGPSTCSICSEEVESLLVLECGHAFGRDCTSKWFKQKNNCPHCRRPILPCECGGTREMQYNYKPPLIAFINSGQDMTGIYQLKPYKISDLCFTSMIYDSESNVFSLRYLDVLI